SSAVPSSDEADGNDSSMNAPTSYREGSSVVGSAMGPRSASVSARSLYAPDTDAATAASDMSIAPADDVSSLDGGRCEDSSRTTNSAGRGGTAAGGTTGASNERAVVGSMRLIGGVGVGRTVGSMRGNVGLGSSRDELQAGSMRGVLGAGTGRGDSPTGGQV